MLRTISNGPYPLVWLGLGTKATQSQRNTIHGSRKCWLLIERKETAVSRVRVATLCQPIHPHLQPPYKVLWAYNKMGVIIHMSVKGKRGVFRH